MKFLSALAVFTSVFSSAFGATFTNPLKDPAGSDPFLVFHEGYYYLLTTTWSDLQITRARTLNGLKTGEKKIVWSSGDSRRANVWAPEVHWINDAWYLYYTDGSADGNLDNQKTYVRKGGRSVWDNYGDRQLVIGDWAIDSTIVRYNGYGNYIVWSCIDGGLQSVCAAPLTSPTTIGRRGAITRPTNSWEDDGDFPVNEGPAAIYKNGRTWITFSANQCWSPTYQLGLLEWTGGDPILASSYRKSGPVFSSANGNYGTAHNGFFTSPDGSEIWNIYHATRNSRGACDANRYTMAQKVNWNSDGTPNFGRAPALSTVLQGPAGEPAN
ncbi:Alpha-L-arabinofuranosidase B-like protein 3 [Elsinoe fawcettii]|nr:Alpha-L-arabinofuranosidase B-like protein 3 [Elsinoe fawcettii]